MSDFKVEVLPVEIEPHPNADRLEIAKVGEYRSVVGKDSFETGDLVAYIPEQAIVPDDVLAELGLTGRLAGKDKNRVKAIRLRGVMSQGICYPLSEGVLSIAEEGDDVSDMFGITKYEPPIPSHMNGEVYNAGTDRCLKYDIENWKRYPDVIAPGEGVVFTEKIHGTWCQIGLVPDGGKLVPVISSKGLAAKGLAFRTDSEANSNNLYLRAEREHGICAKIAHEYEAVLEQEPVYILGEVFGQGVQGLDYGKYATRGGEIGFRAFDIYQGWPGRGVYAGSWFLDHVLGAMGIDRVPVLYAGPFSRKIMQKYTDGMETVSGEERHIRKGIVMRPFIERRHPLLGRVQLKSVSEAYLEGSTGEELN